MKRLASRARFFGSTMKGWGSTANFLVRKLNPSVRASFFWLETEKCWFEGPDFWLESEKFGREGQDFWWENDKLGLEGPVCG